MKKTKAPKKKPKPRGKSAEAHFVTFYSPGTLFSETTTEPILAWDVLLAKQMAKDVIERHEATPFGFRFTTRRRTARELDSKEVAHSPLYYLGGVVETLADIKARKDPNDAILISNMECNGYDSVIVNTNSYKSTMPLGKDDIILPWP